MTDITEEMLHFKEAMRHVWNTCFRSSGFAMSWELQNSFLTIERELFRALVLFPNQATSVADDYRNRPMPVRVRANAGLAEIPVQFGSLDVNGSRRWEFPCMVVAESQRFRFVEYFDWNPYGHTDWSYAKVCTDDGRLAIIETLYCSFSFEADSEAV